MNRFSKRGFGPFHSGSLVRECCTFALRWSPWAALAGTGPGPSVGRTKDTCPVNSLGQEEFGQVQ